MQHKGANEAIIRPADPQAFATILHSVGSTQRTALRTIPVLADCRKAERKPRGANARDWQP